MKLTKETAVVLKNFMNINKNLTIKQGNFLRTINEAKTVIAESVLDIEFPQDFGIADLSNFLNTLNIFNDPDLEFYEDRVVIKEDNVEYDYYRASDAILKDPMYGKNINLGESACEFILSKDQLKNIVKAANTIKSTSISNCSGIHFYKNDNDDIVVEAKLYKDESSKNVYRVIINNNDCDIKDEIGDVIVDSSKFVLIEDDYKVILYKNKCMRLKGLNIPVTYTLAYEIVG